jgi:hypothetical protein
MPLTKVRSRQADEAGDNAINAVWLTEFVSDQQQRAAMCRQE